MSKRRALAATLGVAMMAVATAGLHAGQGPASAAPAPAWPGGPRPGTTLDDLAGVASLPGAVAGPGPNGSGSYDPCASQDTTLPGQGPSLAAPATVPAVPPVALTGPAAAFNPYPGEIPPDYAGTLLRPADTTSYPGPRPAVVLLHGIDGDQCQMWWLGRYLAGAGYLALLVTSPTPPEHDASYGVAIDAARSAVDFLAAPVDNPFAFATDPTDLGIAGWSEGSVAASVVQGLPDMGAVRAIVALDDLRGSFLGDSGAPMTFCAPPVRAPVTPRVPALGFASDGPCDVAAGDTRADVKLSGYTRWRAAGVPSVELPLAGYDHFDYEATDPKLGPVGMLTLAWFDAWLEATTGPLDLFSSCYTDGAPTVGLLSPTYASAAYLPLFGIDSSRWARDLAARCGQPGSIVGTTPVP